MRPENTALRRGPSCGTMAGPALTRTMYFREFERAPGQGPFQGLDLMVEPGDLVAGSPGLRVEAAPRRVRITLGGEPLVWAHIHRHYRGLWRLLSGRSSSLGIVRPLRMAEIAGVEAPPGSDAWWREWSRVFARELVASAGSPLFPGRWALTPARAADAPSITAAAWGASITEWSRFERIEGVRACLDAPSLAWESWWTNGSGAVLRMRAKSPVEGGRVKALRKRAREGRLPPILVYYVSGLDMYLLLDGHERLLAGALEGAPAAFLALWPARATPRRPDPERQEAVVREILRKRGLPRSPRGRALDSEAENRLLIGAFDDAPYLSARTRAYRLAGGVARWEDEAARRSGLPKSHPLFTGEAPDA